VFTLSMVDDESRFVERVGARIRRARERRGWTQLQLANAMAGEHYSSQVSAWETGRRMPSLRNLELLAAALELPTEAFFTD
jgi:transcriptional regulator with XRE-family HTH domain